jgi:Nucleotidyl transferase AbiEii toxin, Type IV TA system
MPLDELHERVAAIALGAAADHGFALGGGNALIAHGIIDRPTQDVDLFSDEEHGVEAASAAVTEALGRSGFRAEPVDKTAGLADVFYGMGEGLAEWVITAPDGRQLALQMAYFEREHSPVVMEFGPVLDLEDALGGKTAALASRAYERDYADVASAMSRGYSAERLIALARRADPGLEPEDFADAGRRLDRLSDQRFAEAGISPGEIAALREQFAAWPREAERPAPEPQSPGLDPGLGRLAEPEPKAWQPEPPDADLEAGQ